MSRPQEAANGMRGPSGIVSDAMLPPTLKRNMRLLATASGDLESQVTVASGAVHVTGSMHVLYAPVSECPAAITKVVKAGS